ncbi:hypothetical protein [Acinetobacter johnsonii]|uniref:hypothetical protein n=1 Tax=Acinetobacter johnsonii TaxID=40214 RepID=UPI001F16EEEA|nr:hypothetical protein [Acinetobacter johnsonii]UJA00758.1 hypothetical protein GBN93_07345 [Acinetobacter johnsonii]
MGLTNTQKIVLSLVVFLVLLIGWGMFPLFFKWVMVGIGSKENELKDFGSLGDIYGSLNTLFTSATLIIVMYSAYLQRQANEDARLAMSKQLRQARNATRKQIRQAQLATRRQLVLAQATHDAQMKESKYSIFSNVFYALLNQKHSRYLSLQTKKDDSIYSAQEIFAHLNQRLAFHLINEWTDVSMLTIEVVKKDYFSTMFEISNTTNHSELFSYFKIILDLYELINRCGLEEEEKMFFKRLLSNSISAGENAALFWLGAFRSELSQMFENERVFSLAHDDFMMPFAVKFYRKDCFHNSDIQNNWKRYTNNETPA